MANRFTEPDEGLEPRPDLEQREGEDDDIFALAEMAITEIRLATDALATGGMTVSAWYEQMADILYAYHLAGWYVGSGTEDDPNAEQMDRIAEVVAEQLDYLDNFRTDLLKDDDDILAPTYRNRAEMYGRATQIGYWIGKTYGLELPFWPAYKTKCTVYCACEWSIEAVENGGFDATWLLGSTDHCDTCKERAKLKPLRIREGKYDRKQVTAKMLA